MTREELLDQWNSLNDEVENLAQQIEAKKQEMGQLAEQYKALLDDGNYSKYNEWFYWLKTRSSSKGKCTFITKMDKEPGSWLKKDK